MPRSAPRFKLVAPSEDCCNSGPGGGSKRIPRKNIRHFAGKSLIAYSILCAQNAGVFDRVVVSTDDDEIASVAESYAAEVPFRRPADLADDYASTVAVMAHAVELLETGQSELSAVCCVYPTAPFMREKDIRRGLKLLDSGEWDFVFGAARAGFPVMRAFEKTPGGGLKMFFPDHYAKRSQDFPEAWHDAGQFYWGKPHSWLEHRPVFGGSSTVVSIPPGVCRTLTAKIIGKMPIGCGTCCRSSKQLPSDRL